MTREAKDAPKFLAKSINQMQSVSRKTPPVYQNLEDMIAARAKVGDMKASSVEILVKRGVVKLEDGVTWRSDPRLKVTSPSYLTEDQVFAFLEAVQAPTLLIQAESGIFSDPKYLAERCEKMHKLTLVKLPGAHHIHLDDPAPVAAAIRRFLN
jgi:pimeloyl-ACP methyl ester carboxylesterase